MTQRLMLEQFLPYRLNRLADTVSREFSQLYRDRLGISRPEWRTLATLGEFGTMTATEIGARSAMHKTKVSRAVAALEERKWLLRTPDEKDRRVERLELTKAGHCAYQDMAPIALAFQADLLERLGGADAETLLRAVDRLEHSLAGKLDL